MLQRLQSYAAMSLAVGFALLQAGCTVAAVPVSPADVNSFTGALAEAKANAEIEPISGPLDLHEALARAIRYNSDLRVREFEVEVEDAKLSAANAALLPDIVAEMSRYNRKERGPGYGSIASGLGASSDLSLSWNILDFGLSYVRARQGGDAVLYKAEEYRRTASALVKETRYAYWRAVAAERLQSRLGKLQSDIDAALKKSAAQEKDPSFDPMDALVYERDLLNEKRELNTFVASLAGASAELKRLISVPQEHVIKLKPATGDVPDSLLKLAPADAVRIAIENRPEIRQLIYQARITSHELDAVVLQKLPALSLTSGLAGSGLNLIANSNWVSLGARAAWSLMSLFRLPKEMDVIGKEQVLQRQQAFAITEAIAMQTHVSIAQSRMLHRVYDDSRKYLRVQKRIENQTHVSVEQGMAGTQPLVRERLSTLLAEIRSALAYAELQNAYGHYQSTLGIDYVAPGNARQLTVSEIATGLREVEKSGWRQLETLPPAPKKIVSLQ